MKLGLEGKTVLVLGASRGLGKAIAIAFAQEGCRVFAAARTIEKIDEWKLGLPVDVAVRVSSHKIDLTEQQTIDALVDELLVLGGVDILINNCGGPAPTTAMDATAEAWEQAFASMASSVFHLTGKLIRPMIKRGFGRIITIGSSGIEQPIANLALSNGIRAAVAGWSKSLASEVAGNGITVNMLLPGRIDTERVRSLDTARAERETRQIEDVQRSSAAEIPAKRYGNPEEFAAVAVFLASEPAAYVTGSMIRVDGGLIKSI